MLDECLDGECGEKAEWTPKVTWNYEVELILGNYSPSLEIPGQILESFGVKSLGSRTHRFASESPGNDQFSSKYIQ